jgi:hypothetical protein
MQEVLRFCDISAAIIGLSRKFEILETTISVLKFQQKALDSQSPLV